MKRITEADAATAFARAWNRLDPTDFLKLLSPNARYASQWVSAELEGDVAISDYLIGKMHTVKINSDGNHNNKVIAELGLTTKGSCGRECVFMTQGQSERDAAVVLFDVENNMIKRYDLCVSELYGVVRSGLYPI